MSFVKPSTQCKIGTINAWSIKNKDTFLDQEIKTNNLDLTLIMETWINGTQEDMAWLQQSDLIQYGYAIFTHNMPSRGARMALLYKEYMEVKKNEAQHLYTIEYETWQVNLKNKTITIFGVDNPPPKQDQTNTTFLDEITKLLNSKLPNMEYAIILGDFNMHIEDLTDNNNQIFADMMEALGLQHHVNHPTHPPTQKETSWIWYSLTLHQK